MRGIHLPKLYIGMEHSRLKNYTLAEEFLKAAQDICPDDPLLENELGYLYYKRKQ